MKIEEKTNDWFPENTSYVGVTVTNTNGKLMALGTVCSTITEVDAVIDKCYSLIQKSIKNDRI